MSRLKTSRVKWLLQFVNIHCVALNGQPATLRVMARSLPHPCTAPCSSGKGLSLPQDVWDAYFLQAVREATLAGSADGTDSELFYWVLFFPLFQRTVPDGLLKSVEEPIPLATSL